MAEENENQESGQGISDGSRPSGITFADIVVIIRKHIATAAICFAVIVGVAGAYAFLAAPQYSATAQVIATYNAAQDGGNSDDITQQNTGGTYVSNQIKSYPTLATTETVLKPVISQLGLDVSVKDLSNQLTVSNPSNTAFVNITATVGDAKQSATIANAVADSLRTIVEHDLYAKGAAAPIKLTVVQRAATPQEPSAPNKKLCIAAGVVLGLIVGIIAALLKDLLRTKVEEASDVRGIVHASALGSIPKNEALEGTRPVIITEPNGSVTEEYRRIRTNIKFLEVNKTPGQGQLLVISSTSPSEGKTTTAVNAAAVLAENGAKVLLIDADLRHPSVAKRLGLEGGVGLAHVLSNQASVKDVVQRYWKPNLHIMPAGPRIQNASVLLNSRIMHELVHQAVQQYDYVIIDTTPMSVANDAAVFGQMGNGVVMISARGVTYKSALRGAVNELRDLDVPLLGYVFNLADEKRNRGYGNYYYYGSYYKGEYGKEDSKKDRKRRRSHRRGK